MKSKLVGLAAALIFAVGAGSEALAQAPASPAQDEAAAQFSPAELDQMLAPIALYPDDLLGQVLMAAGYPLEVVQADRWRQEPANAAMHGDQLTAALDGQDWDPSVKSLVAFPQVLRMMDGDLDWTERLGEAFIAEPTEVMDAVQRLRQRAEAGGKIRTTTDETVTDQDGEITIAPPSQQTVYVPYYEPAVVYGPWAWPDYPPYFFPGYFGDCAFDDFGFCWFGFAIIAPLWGWDHWDWRHHQIDIDQGRFARLDRGHASIGGGVWSHTPTHRHGVPYQQPEARQRVAGAALSPDAARAARGYAAGPNAGRGGSIEEIAPAPGVPPSFESYGSGAAARAQAERGAASRMSAPNYQPRGGGFSRGAPSSAGRSHR